MSQYKGQPITKLRARRRTLADAAAVLRADGYVGLAMYLDARAAEIHTEIVRQEEESRR